MGASKLIKLLKTFAIRIILIMFGETGQVWLESESMIRKLKRGNYWEKEIGLLQHLVSPGDVCLDVGANCGQWTYWMSKQVGSLGRVVAIEPMPMTAQVLGRVVHRLRLSNVEIQQVALGDGNCKIGMLVAENGYKFKSLSTARVLDHSEAFYSAIKVNMVTLTSLIESLGIARVNLIKCDIEGAEMQFFRGGRSLLIRDRPAIICEIEQKHTVRFGYTPNDVFSLLESLGYQSFTYASNVLVPVEGSNPSTINYIFLHKVARPTLEELSMKGMVKTL